MKAIRKIARVLTVYILWLLAVAAGFLALLRLYNTLNVVWPLFGGDPFVLRGVARVYVVIAGVIWMIYIFVTEWHFQRSFPSDAPSSVSEDEEGPSDAQKGWKSGYGVLVQRFAVALTVPVVLFIVDALLRWVAVRVR